MREPEGGTVLNGRPHEKTCRLMEVLRPLPTNGDHAVDVQLGYQVADGSVIVVRPFRDDRGMMCQHGSEIQLFDDFDQLVDFFSELAACSSYQP
jgi:hypothetical protein